MKAILQSDRFKHLSPGSSSNEQSPHFILDKNKPPAVRGNGTTGVLWELLASCNSHRITLFSSKVCSLAFRFLVLSSLGRQSSFSRGSLIEFLQLTVPRELQA
ncbi:hypothetical protein DNTS_031090 [Danionella cerebrum]|uniref:Uncharacterized protein n=1 Tax=Danionella cerebrum TaxID=2873325 RepID=A0A553NM00_9TELE|nr:hypothetical protein DNTS_031090 [Danionella translucida]